MKKVFSIIVLMVHFLSCKENEDKITSELFKKEFAENDILINKSAEEEILQFKSEGINLFHETKKIYDGLRKDYIIVTFASESEEKLKEYLSNNLLTMKLNPEKLLPTEGFEDNNINKTSHEVKSSMHIFLGEVNSKEKYNSITINMVKNKNARIKGVQSYNCDEYTSSGGKTSATAYWYENGNSSNGLDVQFHNKYGWLGAWYFDSGISLYSGYTTHTNVKAEAYKRRLIFCGNYNNYSFSFGD